MGLIYNLFLSAVKIIGLKLSIKKIRLITTGKTPGLRIGQQRY